MFYVLLSLTRAIFQIKQVFVFLMDHITLLPIQFLYIRWELQSAVIVIVSLGEVLSLFFRGLFQLEPKSHRTRFCRPLPFCPWYPLLTRRIQCVDDDDDRKAGVFSSYTQNPSHRCTLYPGGWHSRLQLCHSLDVHIQSSRDFSSAPFWRPCDCGSEGILLEIWALEFDSFLQALFKDGGIKVIRGLLILLSNVRHSWNRLLWLSVRQIGTVIALTIRVWAQSWRLQSYYSPSFFWSCTTRVKTN